MGGTSFDVSLIAEGKSVLSPQTSIDFGLVVRTPMIEIATIGAGGGSIASVDKGGLLNIGPESAGSDPGPVAYGRGNTPPHGDGCQYRLGAHRFRNARSAAASPGSILKRRARQSPNMSASRSGWISRRRRRRSSRWPIPAWPGPCASSPSNAVLTPSNSPTCPSAAAVRCMPAR